MDLVFVLRILETKKVLLQPEYKVHRATHPCQDGCRKSATVAEHVRVLVLRSTHTLRQQEGEVSKIQKKEDKKDYNRNKAFLTFCRSSSQVSVWQTIGHNNLKIDTQLGGVKEKAGG